jgi:predicted GIY-YIG superfamily endonuclease
MHCPHCLSQRTIKAGFLSSGSKRFICRSCNRRFSEITNTNHKMKGHWDSFENCCEVAQKCSSRGEFMRSFARAYAACIERGWIDAVCSHMVAKRAKEGAFCFDRCQELAKECTSKKEFREKHTSAYVACHRKGWIDQVCKHMVPMGHIHNRLVYSIFFHQTDEVYYGLTHNIDERLKGHREASSLVGKRIREGLDFTVTILDENMSQEDAANAERKLICDARKSGVPLLNRVAGGGVGSNKGKYTRESVLEIARRCKDRSEFLRISSAILPVIRRLKMEDEIEMLLPRSIKPNGYWNESTLTEEAKKHSILKEFMKQTAPYSIACKLGILEKITSHMQRRTPNGYWNYERCLELAKKVGSKPEFCKQKPAYISAHRHGFLSRIYAEMNW